MGNADSNLLKVCGSSVKKERKRVEEDEDDQEMTDTVIVQRNKDHYFEKEDYVKIMEKFPKFKEWIDQSANAQNREKPKQKRIKWREAEVIGHGSYGRVVMGLNLETGSIMAVKQVQMCSATSQQQQERVLALEMEIDLLSLFSHKNIVRYYGSHRNKNTFNIFLEYISGGTIASLLDKYGPFNENLIRVYTRQILEGLEYLHVRNTIHRDIKGANVLVDNSGICKLADFGTAKRISALVESDLKSFSSIRGTVHWMAPEIIKQNSLGRFCDIWSVGCTVIEMATGKAPWSGIVKPNSNTVSALYQIAQAKGHPPIPKHLSPEAVDFLKQCFKINPLERPNVLKLLQHKFISGIESLYQSFDSTTRGTPELNTKASQVKPTTQGEVDLNQKSKPGFIEVPKSLGKMHSAPPKSGQRLEDQDGDQANGEKGESQTVLNSTTNSIARNLMSSKYQAHHQFSLKATTKETNPTETGKNETGSTASTRPTLPTEAGREVNCPLVDLASNKQVSIRSRPLGKEKPTNTKNGYADLEEEEFTAINGLIKKKATPLETNYKGNVQVHYYNSQKQTGPLKRSGSNEIVHEIEEDVEGEKEDQAYEEERPKGPQVGRKQIILGIDINTQEEGQEDSDASHSRDSDREPSSLQNLSMKHSAKLQGVENNSFSNHTRFNIHDVSSRISIRKDGSFDTRLEHNQTENSLYLQAIKERRARSILEGSKVEQSALGRKSDAKLSTSQRLHAYHESMNQKSGYFVPQNMSMSSSKENAQRMNKILDNWNQVASENNTGGMNSSRVPKRKQDEKSQNQEITNGEYLQKFNLLDDLNKIYGQLEATNPPLGS